MKTKQLKYSKRLGNALPMAMMFFMVVGVVTIAAIGVTQTADRMAERGVQKTQATALAETAVNLLYDEIIRKIATGQSAPASLGSTSVTVFDGVTKTAGTYNGTVLDTQVSTKTPAPGQADGTIEYTYNFLIQGVGQAPNGVQSEVRASFTAKLVTNDPSSGVGAGQWKIYPGAIQSATTVDIVTNQGVRTMDSAAIDKEAHVIANKGVTWLPYSGSKNTYVNPNILDFEGHVLVASQPDNTFVDMTKGVNGLGNPNGMKNYRTAAAHLNGSDPYTVNKDEITAMGQPRSFPKAADVQSYKTIWLNETAGNPAATKFTPSTGTSVKWSDVPANANGQKVIQAPAYIDGDLDLASGQLLKMRPCAACPEDNIVYVKGKISNAGMLYNLGVTLVAEEGYSDAAAAEYKVDQQDSPFPDLPTVYSNSALISLSPYTDGITISSNSTSRYGMVMSALGGIKITGNLEVNGILVSAGNAADPYYEKVPAVANRVKGGKVDIKPNNGNSFVVQYVREASNYKIPGYNMVVGTVATSFNAEPLRDWVTKK
ncbi:MAG: hypothetical protein KDC26_01290 [Armatimonadetes bacterium]|nr:hypothetical protein [Armatimonadota bacterium]